jgi:hypothetical protein
MSDRKNSKLVHELLLPGDSVWEHWQATGANAFAITGTSEHGPSSFSSGPSRHTLALPATSVWVLPAWLKTETAYLRDAAMLHLERVGARTPSHDQSVLVESLQEKDGSHLTRTIALKDTLTPLADFKIPPSECRLSASCYPLPADSLVIWRELGRLVLAITSGPRLVYFTSLSSHNVDSNAISEINHICLQLSFQRVLTEVDGIVLWCQDGDVEKIHAATGLEVTRQDKPAPRLAGSSSRLMPQDILDAQAQRSKSARTRLTALAAGFVIAAGVAGFAFLIGKASQDRDALLEQVAAISPRAAKVGGQKSAWQEAATAVDPSASPMQLLLGIMEPSASNEVTITEFEWTPAQVILRGRAPEISPALKYMQEVKDTESLLAYTWEPGNPEIGENGAAFEVKGTRP